MADDASSSSTVRSSARRSTAPGAAVFVWNEERRYVAVNEEACRLVGLSREELIGMPVGDLSPDSAAGDIERATRGAVLARPRRASRGGTATTSRSSG